MGMRWRGDEEWVRWRRGEDWDRCSGVGGWPVYWFFFRRDFFAVERALMVSSLDGSRAWFAQSTPFPCHAFSTYGDEMVCHPCR